MRRFVECADQRHAAGLKVEVVEQCMTQITTADNDDGILDGETENVGDFLAQRFDIITVSLLTKFAKAAEILTHLRGGQSQPLCQNGRGNADTFFMIQFVNAAIISRHPGNHGI